MTSGAAPAPGEFRSQPFGPEGVGPRLSSFSQRRAIFTQDLAAQQTFVNVFNADHTLAATITLNGLQPPPDAPLDPDLLQGAPFFYQDRDDFVVVTRDQADPARALVNFIAPDNSVNTVSVDRPVSSLDRLAGEGAAFNYSFLALGHEPRLNQTGETRFLFSAQALAGSAGPQFRVTLSEIDDAFNVVSETTLPDGVVAFARRGGRRFFIGVEDDPAGGRRTRFTELTSDGTLAARFLEGEPPDVLLDSDGNVPFTSSISGDRDFGTLTTREGGLLRYYQEQGGSFILTGTGTVPSIP